MPAQYQIRDVWTDNLNAEMAYLRTLVEKYPYISMDTEFPGVVARPVGNFKSNSDYQFQTLRCNVDLLKIIQLGLTFSDENGNLPNGVCTWQFNFKFILSDDMFAQDSIDLLQKSGIDFQKHSQQGIDIEYFGELLISSGFVLLDDVKWIAFHGTYDFGYLLKLLTCEALPEEEMDFHQLLRLFFPCLYDIKYLMKSCKNLKGGLQEVADNLTVERVGPQHQAGSDSLLTSVTFFKLRKLFFEDKIDDLKYLGHLYGLGTPYQSRTTASVNINNTNSSTPVNNNSTSFSNQNASGSSLNLSNNVSGSNSGSNNSGNSNSGNSNMNNSSGMNGNANISNNGSNATNPVNGSNVHGWKSGYNFSYEANTGNTIGNGTNNVNNPTNGNGNSNGAAQYGNGTYLGYNSSFNSNDQN